LGTAITARNSSSSDANGLPSGRAGAGSAGFILKNIITPFEPVGRRDALVKEYADHEDAAQGIVSFGGTYNWDCTGGGTTKISMSGPASSVFANTNYGMAVSFSTFGTTVTAVTCTTCHDQHSQNVYSGKMGGVTGYYQTAFFLRGYYNPTTGGNNAAQFCRQCHGGESNEMNGQKSVPTT
jgi:cytochrome c553